MERVLPVTNDRRRGRARRFYESSRTHFVCVGRVCGLCLSIFVDHGDQFECRDADGERPVVRLVESISCEKQGLVRYAVPDGVPATSPPIDSLYAFSDVQGCCGSALGGSGLNDCAPFPFTTNKDDPANSFQDRRHDAVVTVRGRRPHHGDEATQNLKISLIR